MQTSGWLPDEEEELEISSWRSAIPGWTLFDLASGRRFEFGDEDGFEDTR